MSHAVNIENLQFQYPKSDRPALGGVSFTVRNGETFALLGPNGGGKTTLFRLLATLLPLQGGSVTVFDHDLRKQRAAVRARLGVVFQHPSLDAELSALENLTHHGRLYGLGGADLKSRIAAAVERFELADFARRRTGKLSGGQQRRVELAKAMLHSPALLLMDEPTAGLDPVVRHNLWQTVDKLRAERGLTVLLTTHLLDEADRCDRVAILDQGKLAAIDTPAALKSQVAGQVVTVQPRPVEADAVADLLRRDLPDAGFYFRAGDGAIRFETDRGPALVGELTHSLGDRIERISVGPPTLDDVFLHVTGHLLDRRAEN